MSETNDLGSPVAIVTNAPDDPWGSLGQLFEQFHQELFPTFGPSFRWVDLRGAAATDIEDTGAAFELHADLPGFSKEQIEVRVHGRVVSVKAGAGEEASSDGGKKFLRRERSYRGAERQFELPEPVAADQVTARFENGVLHLTVPKAHPVEERKITIA